MLQVELEGDDGVFVTFNDGTTAGYVVEELLELRPFREPFRLPRTKVGRTGTDAYFPTDLPPAIA